jgi:ABC-2 type transport system ATP-binding protein
MDIVLEGKNLVKHYQMGWRRQKIIALDHLNFQIKKGEIYGLLGPNGSGKTTAIKAFLGMLRLDDGEIKVFGEKPNVIAVKSRIGYLPEESHFYKFLTVEESLMFFGQLAGLEKHTVKQKIDGILDQIGLLKVKHRGIQHFSKGMLRRLGFGFILLKDPEIIFLDEPTIGLDPIGMQQMKEMMLGLQQRGKTIVLSSHLLGEIENVCDRVAILYKGKMLKEDRLENLLSISNKIQLIFKGTNTIDVDEIKKILEASGVGIETVGHPRKTLEEAFLEIIPPNL